ncbi:MAG TPA: phosphorylase [Acidobacteriota bacterium]|nr:phosphorylase [Acidobacteriota bacterium]HOT01185.1 phosphorylase [Acidobacteriota bacterium]HQF86220.1 phosphorylase [Acidobacteriota bacterium]HQG90536.1 phosphorylase [Acidobacteriota bacterium]HQK86242.1 phosphorylase [Acidobacteriota bacterium]
MPDVLAVIGGSDAYRLLQAGAWRILETVAVPTPFGEVSAIQRIAVTEDLTAWFLSRHGQENYAVSAPFVNYRANIYALKELGTARILAWSGPGTLHADRHHPGELVLPTDIIDETRRRSATFFAGRGWGFIRSSPCFCPGIRSAFLAAGAVAGLAIATDAVYVCTEGPRLETAAEIRKLRRDGGDLVGMTLAPEAFLARELEICYAPLCYVTNYAEGVVERAYRGDRLFGGMLSETERDAVDRAVQHFPRLFCRALELLAEAPRDCPCAQAMRRYTRDGRLDEDWHKWIGNSDA